MRSASLIGVCVLGILCLPSVARAEPDRENVIEAVLATPNGKKLTKLLDRRTATAVIELQIEHSPMVTGHWSSWDDEKAIKTLGAFLVIEIKNVALAAMFGGGFGGGESSQPSF